MKVMNTKTGKTFKVIKIDYLFNYPSSVTEYTLEDGRKLTNGEIWAEFVQVPEIRFGKEEE